MSSLSEILPPPKHAGGNRKHKKNRKKPVNSSLLLKTEVPPTEVYDTRRGWLPHKLSDYCSFSNKQIDGGAFPEILFAQFPLQMGWNEKKNVSDVIPAPLDENGQVRFSFIATQNTGSKKIVHSHANIIPSKILDDDDPDLKKPSEEEIQKTTERTKLALEKIISTKIATAMPVKTTQKPISAQYIRYTPAPQGNSSGPRQSIVRMTAAQVDPMNPPSFKINKIIPPKAPSPPAPVLHSPPRVSVKQQELWKIPPCVSSWKNHKGYFIPLDKRINSDSRGLQPVHINQKFSKLAEALYIADRKARDSMEARSNLEKRLVEKERDQREKELSLLAKKAREYKTGNRVVSDDSEDELTDSDEEAAAERKQIRAEKRKQRKKERCIAMLQRKKMKLDRDIAEQKALGLLTKSTSEPIHDQRLFENTSGVGTGFGDADSYPVYDKELNAQDTVAANIYNAPTATYSDLYGDEFEKIATTRRFIPDKNFPELYARRGPVQFEKKTVIENDPVFLMPVAPAPRTRKVDVEDPFGLDKFLSEVKRSQKPKKRFYGETNNRYDVNKKR